MNIETDGIGEINSHKRQTEGILYSHLQSPYVEGMQLTSKYKVFMYTNYDEPLKKFFGGEEKLTLEIGMGAAVEPTPALIAYLEQGIQRLLPFIQYKKTNVQLRLFSMAGLCINGEDRMMINARQKRQQQLFDRYIDWFYPELRPYIATDDICQTMAIPTDIDEIVQAIRSLNDETLIADLESRGSAHGGELGASRAIVYAACHLLPEAFGYREDKGIRVAVGCAGEHPFNRIRHQLEGKSYGLASMSLVIEGALSRTPPYLYSEMKYKQTGKKRRQYGNDSEWVNYYGPMYSREFIDFARTVDWASTTLDDALRVHFNTANQFNLFPGYPELRYVEECMKQFGGMEYFLNFLINNQYKFIE